MTVDRFVFNMQIRELSKLAYGVVSSKQFI